MVLKIVDIKTPVLREEARKVGKIDKKVKKLIADMKETLLAQSDPEGVGLAAPQVGKSLQIFIMHYPDEEIDEKVVINPVIIGKKKPSSAKAKGGKGKQILEGCLSLPHYYGPVKREKEITIRYVDESGNEQTETFSGFVAQIVAHEIDHLHGRLFLDHIFEQKAKLYFIRDDEAEEVEI